jgi:MSHA pilin protein MshC
VSLARETGGGASKDVIRPFSFSSLRSATSMKSGVGFTTVELVVTIVIAGLLAAVAAVRFVDRDGFASRGFSDEAIGVVRYAQKTAIAWRRPIFVCLTANSIRASAVAGCGTPLNHPATGAPLVATAPNGVTVTTDSCPNLAAAGFSFNGQGQPSAAATINLCSTVAGDPSRRIVVQAETGHVHQ